MLLEIGRKRRGGRSSDMDSWPFFPDLSVVAAPVQDTTRRFIAPETIFVPGGLWTMGHS